jgi:prolyl-tRNA editing enzyme YbaK/EbsC (Cys-tRNA(Pro) deacylase)
MPTNVTTNRVFVDATGEQFVEVVIHTGSTIIKFSMSPDAFEALMSKFSDLLTSNDFHHTLTIDKIR